MGWGGGGLNRYWYSYWHWYSYSAFVSVLVLCICITKGVGMSLLTCIGICITNHHLVSQLYYKSLLRVSYTSELYAIFKELLITDLKLKDYKTLNCINLDNVCKYIGGVLRYRSGWVVIKLIVELRFWKSPTTVTMPCMLCCCQYYCELYDMWLGVVCGICSVFAGNGQS